MTPLLDKCAFTLIELLVVVLIIGIVAAVALPQYQKTTHKAKFASVFPLIREIRTAQELYALERGAYARDLSQLPIQITLPPEITIDPNFSSTGAIRTIYCPGRTTGEKCDLSSKKKVVIADVVLSNSTFISNTNYKQKAGDIDCLSKRYGFAYFCQIFCAAFGPCTIND